MVEMIHKICDENQIEFQTFSGNWLLELVKGGKRARILGYKFSLNDSVAASIAQDKVAAYEVLAKEGVPAIKHTLVRTKTPLLKQPEFAADMVIKPLSGTSGHAVHKVSSWEQAEKVMDLTGIEAWAISPYEEIVRETRILVLDDMILLSYDKQPIVENGLKFFNLGKGAKAINRTIDESEEDLANAARLAIGVRLAAIDIVELASGEKKILEVNDGIMMENYARQSLENKEITHEIYRIIIKTLFK